MHGKSGRRQGHIVIVSCKTLRVMFQVAVLTAGTCDVLSLAAFWTASDCVLDRLAL